MCERRSKTEDTVAKLGGPIKSVSANSFQKKLLAAMINSPCITPMAVGWLVEMKGRLFFLLVAAGTRRQNRLPGPTKD